MVRTVGRIMTGVAVAALFVSMTSCAEVNARTFTIRVAGSPQTRFIGQCSATENGQTTRGIDLKGALTYQQDAVEFEVVGGQIYCAVYAQNLDGMLTLELLSNGELLDSSQTSEPFQDITVEFQSPVAPDS